MLVLAVVAATARAGGDGTGAAPLTASQENAAFVAEVRAAFRPLQPKLEALGDWCGTATLFLQRSHIAEALLVFDPENESARGWLRYKRQKDGTWQQSSARPFLDDKPDFVEEWKKRRAEVEGEARSVLLPFADRAGWETAAGRSWVIRGLVAMDPDDVELRVRAGEVLVGKRWVLKETAATPAGRRSVREATKKALQSTAGVKPEHPADPDWTSTSNFERVSVRAMLPPAAADEIAQRSAQAVELLALVLGSDVRPPADFQILVLASHADAPRFLAQQRGLSAADRDYMAKQGGFWLSKHQYVCTKNDQPDRVDSIVREVFEAMHADFGSVCDGPAWLSEGMGMYLTYCLIGTRLNPLHNRSEYSNQDVIRALDDNTSDWASVLRGMLEKGFDPKIPALLTTPLNSLTKEDGLVAYVLAEYFLAGRGGDLRAVLTRMHAGCKADRAIPEVCDVDAEGLQQRFVRWLRETK